MSEMIRRCLVEESKIVVTIEIPVNLAACEPLEHLANEGQIEKGVIEGGRAASEVLFRGIADRHNGRESYHTEQGYKLSQRYRTTEEFVSPYGHISVTRPYFCNDHRKLSDTPFERETLMAEHHITPMAQYVLLRMLANKGPEVSAKDFREERGVKVSHHLVDTFLEDMGLKYQDLRDDFLDEVVREDWQPSWRPCLSSEPSESDEEGPEDQLALHRALETELAQTVIPVVQTDAMKVGVREYEERVIDGKRNCQKYGVEFHELHNAFIGFQALRGPRQANDPLEFYEVRYMSEYFAPDALPQDTADYLKGCGVELGSPVICMGDGDKSIWKRYQSSFKDFQRIDILDLRHCRNNLREFVTVQPCVEVSGLRSL